MSAPGVSLLKPTTQSRSLFWGTPCCKASSTLRLHQRPCWYVGILSLASRMKARGLLHMISWTEQSNSSALGSSSPRAFPPRAHGWHGGPAM